MTAVIIIISCLAILVVSGQAWVMRKQAVQQQASAGDGNASGTAEAMLGVVGTLFSLLLGLLVAGAIDRYHEAAQNAESEANGVGNIYRLARGLEEADRKRLRSLCRDYWHNVVTEEWPLMQQQEMGKNTQNDYNALWEACISANPQDDRENNIHQAILGSMDDVGDDRRARVVVCMTKLPLTLWAVIVCGSAITIVFTHLFTQHMGKLHWMMTLLVALSLGLNVWLLAAYSTPFAGDLALQPIGFQLLEKMYHSDDDSAARYLTPSERTNTNAQQHQQAR